MAGVDGLPEALAAIKNGDLAATVFQDPEGQGGGGVWGCYLAGKGVKLPKDLLIPFTPGDARTTSTISSPSPTAST